LESFIKPRSFIGFFILQRILLPPPWPSVQRPLTGPAHRPGANAFWSKQFNCNVSYIFPKSIFCFLEQNEKFIKILSTNGELGWIHLSDWWKEDIEEVTV
jgi:hypothetical protein